MTSLTRSQLSDTEKMILQLQLDVKKFGEILETFGIQLSSLTQYDALALSLK